MPTGAAAKLAAGAGGLSRGPFAATSVLLSEGEGEWEEPILSEEEQRAALKQAEEEFLAARPDMAELLALEPEDIGEVRRETREGGVGGVEPV